MTKIELISQIAKAAECMSEAELFDIIPARKMHIVTYFTCEQDIEITDTLFPVC